MAKGYWIVRGEVSNPEAYKAYVAANAAAFSKFGARFLARAGKRRSPLGRDCLDHGAPHAPAGAGHDQPHVGHRITPAAAPL